MTKKRKYIDINDNDNNVDMVILAKTTSSNIILTMITTIT